MARFARASDVSESYWPAPRMECRAFGRHDNASEELSPGDLADPGLASVRGVGWLGPTKDAKASRRLISSSGRKPTPAWGQSLSLAARTASAVQNKEMHRRTSTLPRRDCSACWSQPRGWEPKTRRRRLISAFDGQGPRTWQNSYFLDPEAERKFIADSVETIQKVTGQQPMGWNAYWMRRFCCKLCCWRTSRMIEGERSGGRQYGSG
jgi:hypothetical protein